MNGQKSTSRWHRLLGWLGAPFCGQSQQYIFEVRQVGDPQEVQKRWESLSPRQREVAVLICRGYTNPQIASELKISLETVKTHVRNILQKFNLHSKAELRFLISVQEPAGRR